MLEPRYKVNHASARTVTLTSALKSSLQADAIFLSDIHNNGMTPFGSEDKSSI